MRLVSRRQMERLHQLIHVAPPPVYFIGDATRSLPSSGEIGLTTESSRLQAGSIAQKATTDAGEAALLRQASIERFEEDRLLPIRQFASALRRDIAEVERLADAGAVITTVAADGTRLVPAFQLVGEPPEIPPEVASVTAILRPVLADPDSLVTWFVAPKEGLEGVAPAEWISAGRPGERVIAIAEDDAARLGPA